MINHNITVFFFAPSSFIFGTWCLSFFRVFFPNMVVQVNFNCNCTKWQLTKRDKDSKPATVFNDTLPGTGGWWNWKWKRRFTVGRDKMHSLIDRQMDIRSFPFRRLTPSRDVFVCVFHLLPLRWLSADVCTQCLFEYADVSVFYENKTNTIVHSMFSEKYYIISKCIHILVNIATILYIHMFCE